MTSDATAPSVRLGLRATLRKLAASGCRLECPLCRSRCRRFRAGGTTNRAIVEKRIVGAGHHALHRCPVCKSRRRERLAYLYLARRTPLLSGAEQTVLHLAPEPGISEILSALPRVTYVSGDLGSRRAGVRMDVTALPVPDDAFDIVVCNHVLEHVDDDRLAIAELHRALAPGGVALLQVPFSRSLTDTQEDPTITSPEAREREYGQHDHVRLYARSDYVARLAQGGFAVEQFDWRQHADFGASANSYGLDDEEPLFVGRKL